MIRRSILAVLLLSLVTFGIYGLVWLVKTKNEMQAMGATDIPTAWLLIIPFASIYWMWKYAGGVEQITGGKTSQALAFILLMVLGIVGFAVIQDNFNKIADQSPRALGASAVG